jgi:hypothetical protein
LFLGSPLRQLRFVGRPLLLIPGVGTGFQFRFHVTNLLPPGLPERHLVSYL